MPSLPAGTYSVTAYYSSDPNTEQGQSLPQILQVLSKSSTTTLTAPTTAVFAAQITLSAAVVPASANGLVRFLDNGTLLGTTALLNGAATFFTAALTPGPHILAASFTGDPNDDPSTGTAALTIDPAPSAITASLTQPTVLAGAPALVNVRVITSSPGPNPTGTLTLRSGPTILATGTLTNGAAGAAYATLSIPTPAAGTYPLIAYYSGDGNFAPSDSSTIVLAYTVAPRIASGTLTLSATQVPPQTPITLIAAFSSPGTSGPALIPTGTVTFSSGTTALVTVPLDPNGQATATLPASAVGTYTLTAVYTPTGIFTAAPVTPQTLKVTPPLAVAFLTPALTMTIASTADAMLTLTTLSGYQGAVSTQCTTSQPFLTCTVDAPTTLTGPTTAKLHLTVASKSAALSLPGSLGLPEVLGRTLAGTATTFALLFPLLFNERRKLLLTHRRRRLPTLLTLLLTVTLLNTLTGCAQGGTFGDVPPGTYYIQLTATAANTPTTATLTVNIH